MNPNDRSTRSTEDDLLQRLQVAEERARVTEEACARLASLAIKQIHESFNIALGAAEVLERSGKKAEAGDIRRRIVAALQKVSA